MYPTSPINKSPVGGHDPSLKNTPWDHPNIVTWIAEYYPWNKKNTSKIPKEGMCTPEKKSILPDAHFENLYYIPNLSFYKTEKVKHMCTLPLACTYACVCCALPTNHYFLSILSCNISSIWKILTQLHFGPLNIDLLDLNYVVSMYCSAGAGLNFSFVQAPRGHTVRHM